MCFFNSLLHKFGVLVFSLVLCKLVYASGVNSKEEIRYAYNQVDRTLHLNDVSEKTLNNARRIVLKCIANAKKNNWKSGELAGIIRLGIIAIHENQNQKALEYNFQVLYSGTGLAIEDKQLLYESMGYCFGGLGLPEESIAYHKKLIKILPESEVETRYKCYSSIAHQYMLLSNFELSRRYNSIALSLAKKSKNGFFIIQAYNNLGWDMYNLNRLQEAVETLKAGLIYFEKSKEHNWSERLLYAMIYRNLGIVQIKAKKYDKALEYFENSTRNFKNIEAKDFLDRNQLLIIETLVLSDDCLKAEGKMKMLDRHLLSEADLMHLLQLEVKVFKCKGLYDKSFASQEKLLQLRERKNDNSFRNNAKNLSRLTKIKVLNVNKNLVLQKKIHARDRDIKAVQITLLIVVLVFVLLTGLFVYLKFRSDYKKKESLLKSEKELTDRKLEIKSLEEERLKIELEYKDRDLSNFALEISRRHSFIEEINSLIGDIKPKLGEHGGLLNPLIQILKDNSIVDEKTYIFFEKVDQLNSEFMLQLEKQFPVLSKNERQFCALLKLGLSTKDIAIIKNLSVESVKTFRYRIRKKINLDHNVDLNEFFSNL